VGGEAGGGEALAKFNKLFHWHDGTSHSPARHTGSGHMRCFEECRYLS
jgi:hypothetical protein